MFVSVLVPVLAVILPSVSCSKDGGSHDSPAGPSKPAATAALEQQAFARVNEYRASKKLPPLAWNDAIAARARRHSEDMASGAVGFGHDGVAQRAAAIAQTTPWRAVAENVAMSWNEPDPAQAAATDWIDSAEHRANIEGDFNLTGIGAATAPNGAVYFTQIFVKSR